MSFNPNTVRLSTQIGSPTITAECLLPGCGWATHFTYGAQWLATILDACERHPCKTTPCPTCGHREGKLLNTDNDAPTTHPGPCSSALPTIGHPAGDLRCQLRHGHAGDHESGETRWWREDA